MFKANALSIIGLVFSIVGLPFLVISIFVGVANYKFIHTADRAQGKVVELISSQDSEGSRTYRPKVSFQSTNGESHEYISSSGTNPPAHKVGDKVTLYYENSNPDNAKIDSFMDLWFLPAIMGLLGVIFFGIGGCIIMFQIKKKQTNAWLKIHGQKVMADFVSLGEGLVEVNGEKGTNIVCQWLNPQDNKLYVFKSGDLWMDPTRFIQNKQIPVVINPANPHQYFVDTSFLPKVA